MSDNEDLLGDDLGDHSLADYNLGNEEEEQLLADDYDGGPSQNVPTANAYREQAELVPTEYSSGTLEYSQPLPYIQPETESVVPNITVEVPNTQTYTPYRETYEQEHAVPPAIPAAPIESPQIVPSEITGPANIENQERSGEAHTQRLPLPRNIPDSLDKVFVPNFPGRGRSWRNPNRHFKPYRRYNNFRGHFNPRGSFSPPIRPQIRPEMQEIHHDMPPMGPEISPERPILPQELPIDRQFNQNFQRFQFRPNIEDRPNFGNIRPNAGPMFYQRPAFNPRFPPMREIIPNTNHLPQVTIRQPLPLPVLPAKEPEVRMLPVSLPPNLPPAGLAGKKVLINPHFKGNFQPPVEGPSAHVDEAAERFIAEQREALARAARREPMRYIENTTIEIENELARSTRRSDDDLLRRQEEFINANRAGLRRRMRSPSPRRNEERRSPERRRGSDEQDSEYRRRVREQETLRERVLRAKEVRRRKNAVALQKHLTDRDKDQDKETKPEEKKEIKPATPMIEQDKPDTTRRTPEKIEKEKIDTEEKRDRSPVKIERTEANSTCDTLTPPPLTPPLPRDSDDDLDLILDDIDDILSDDDTGRFKEKNNKIETPKPQVDLRSKLPPRENKPRQKIVFEKEEKKEKSPIRRTILTGAKHNTTEKKETKPDKVKSKSKTEANSAPVLKQRQKIIFDKLSQKQEKEKPEKEKPKSQFPNRRVILQRKVQPKDKMIKLDPSRPNPGIFSRALGGLAPELHYDSDSNGETERTERTEKKESGVIALVDNLPFGMTDTRLKTLAGDVQSQKQEKEKPEKEKPKSQFPNRRVILQRKVQPKDKTIKLDPSRPNPGIFSRALGGLAPELHYDSDSNGETERTERTEKKESGVIALVDNLPFGMTDTRLKTLAGDVQSLILDKEERKAKITFKTNSAAESFRKKFNNKMVAASRLSVNIK